MVKHLRNRIFKFVIGTPRPYWLPNITELDADTCSPPESLMIFLTYLLQTDKHAIPHSRNFS